MVDVSSVDISEDNQNVSLEFHGEIKAAITEIRSRGKRPDEVSVTEYVLKHFATNVDGNFIKCCIKNLLHKNILKNKPTPKGNSYFIVEEKFLTDYKQTDFTEESLLDELATPNLTELATPNLTLDPEFLGDSRVILRPEFDALKFQVEELIRQTKPAISEEIECQLRRQVDGLRAELDSKNVIINILQKQLEAINSMNRETQFLPTNVLSTNSTTTQYKLPKKFATKGNHRKSSDKQFTIPINNRFHTLESDYNENVNLVVNGNHGNYSNGRNRQLSLFSTRRKVRAKRNFYSNGHAQ